MLWCWLRGVLIVKAYSTKLTFGSCVVPCEQNATARGDNVAWHIVEHQQEGRATLVVEFKSTVHIGSYCNFVMCTEYSVQLGTLLWITEVEVLQLPAFSGDKRKRSSVFVRPEEASLARGSQRQALGNHRVEELPDDTMPCRLLAIQREQPIEVGAL